MSGRGFASALLAIASLSAAPARADAEAAPGTVLRQEAIGGEVAPLSINQGSPPLDPPPSRVQPGLGLKLRLFRHRWLQGAYWTPVQAGGFLGFGAGQDGTVLLDLQTEGGGILRFGTQTLEAGLAVGGGVLAIRYGSINATHLVIGGVGWMISPVIRYLFREARSHTLGVVFRAEIPLSLPPDNYDWLGHWTARGMLFLIAFDAGFGWG